jgi:predicted heme/steroid binding protein
MELIDAAMEGDIAAMEAALGADTSALDFQDPGGQTALHWVALNGHLAATVWLLAQDPPPSLEAVNEGGQTPLMGAAMRDHAEVLQALVGAGACLDACDAEGLTAYAWAATHDSLRCETPGVAAAMAGHANTAAPAPLGRELRGLNDGCHCWRRCVEALTAAGADDLAHHLRAEYEKLPPVTAEKLRRANGTGELLYVGVMGLVYDMAQSANFYGPGGNYEMFAGCDCALSLAKNALEVCAPRRKPCPTPCSNYPASTRHHSYLLTRSLRQIPPPPDAAALAALTVEERCALEGWVGRFQAKYRVVGRLMQAQNPALPAFPWDTAGATTRGAVPKL